MSLGIGKWGPGKTGGGKQSDQIFFFSLPKKKKTYTRFPDKERNKHFIVSLLFLLPKQKFQLKKKRKIQKSSPLKKEKWIISEEKERNNVTWAHGALIEALLIEPGAKRTHTKRWRRRRRRKCLIKEEEKRKKKRNRWLSNSGGSIISVKRDCWRETPQWCVAMPGAS